MTDPHNAQARLSRSADPADTVGCGLLVTPRHVVTCAHVVAAALADAAGETAPHAPAGDIPIDLPLLPHPFRTTGKIIRWLPVREGEGKAPEDIAVLELAEEAPPEAEPAPLLNLAPKDYADLKVQCFGFPAGIDEGTYRPGTCRGENTLGRVQLDVERGLVEGGFSGTAAWDLDRGAVGLVVAARTEEQSAQLIPVRTLFAAWPELDRTWRPRNPYKALAAFGPEDRPDFFGRADLIPLLAERIARERLTTLLGPSGSGKSSLIGAGLIPALIDGGGWRCLVTRPGADPFDELAARLVQREGLTLSQRKREREDLAGALAADLPGVLREHLADHPGERLLLVVDQLEELFTNAEPANPNKARSFAQALQDLPAGDLPLHLLLGLRADFMGRAMDGPAKAFVAPEHQFQVGPLEGEALRAAVEGPATGLGVRYAPGLVDGMLAELEDQPGRLPLLQFALTRLWDEQRHRAIDAEALGRIGGVRRALSQYADGVIRDLPEADRPRARRVLVQLVRPPEREDEAATRQVASWRRIPEQDQDLLPRLAGTRLIVTSLGEGDEPMAEIAHEALIREWDRLKTWVAEDRDFRLWQEGLRSRMADWEAHKNDPGFLLGGKPLTEAEGWLAASPHGLSKDDRDYIAVSRRREDRNRRRKNAAVGAVILVLAGLSAFALVQRDEALNQKQQAVAAAVRAVRNEKLAKQETERAEKSAVRATTARNAAENLIQYMTFDLRQKLEPLGKLELLRDAQQRVDGYYELLGVLEDNPEVMRRRAANLLNSGDLKIALGDLRAGVRLYSEGSEILARLADAEPDNTDRQRDLAVSLNKVGDIKAAQGDLSGALGAYEESQGIRERLAGSDPSNAQWQYDLGISNERVGSVKQAQGKLEEALAAYQRKYELVKALAEQDPSNAGWQVDLAKSLLKTAAAMIDTKPEEAGVRLAKAMAILQGLEDAGKLHGQDRALLEELRKLTEPQQPGDSQ